MSARIIRSTCGWSQTITSRSLGDSVCGRYRSPSSRILLKFTEIINVAGGGGGREGGDNWVEFFIDESWGAVCTFLEFRSSLRVPVSSRPLISLFSVRLPEYRRSPLFFFPFLSAPFLCLPLRYLSRISSLKYTTSALPTINPRDILHASSFIYGCVAFLQVYIGFVYETMIIYLSDYTVRANIVFGSF